MQRSSVGLYQTLIPGISNVTLRVRYFGLYTWLSHRYASEIGETDTEVWRRFVRRTEALFALIANRKGGESGVAGIEWASKALNDLKTDSIDFAAASDPGRSEHYLAQKWGTYPLYASQLHELRVFAEAAAHEIPVPSDALGLPLVEAFKASLGKLDDELFGIIQKGHVTLAELDRLSPAAPSSIPTGSTECQLYSDILFAATESPRENDDSRRKTLLLILQVAAQSGQPPSVMDLRWSLYNNKTHTGSDLSLTESDLEAQRMRWKVYQANDLSHIALEALLKYVLDLLEAYPGGVSLRQLIGDAVDAIVAEVQELPASWQHLIDEVIKDEDIDDASLCDEVMAAANWKSTVSPTGAWTAIRLLALVYYRASQMEELVAEVFGGVDSNVLRSMHSEISFLKANSELDMVKLIRQLLEQRVVRRHLWVAMRKLRHQDDYTFLIESDDGLIRLRAKDGPTYTTPRLAPSITFLHDLHLMDRDGVTALGKSVLKSA
ncbi:hypothetical protein N9F33_01590 [Pseudomonadales bacterium]|nr:hypothetical protein [Pseudomonadales bacterium]